MKKAGFEFRDHTADIQVYCYGPSLEQAFEQAALSLMTIISPDLSKIDPKIEKKIEINAEDKEALLFDFLSEFLYIFDVDELIFSKIKVESITKVNDEYCLKARMLGEKFDLKKHEGGTIVKAITYSYMEINEEKEKVSIKVIFDI